MVFIDEANKVVQLFLALGKWKPANRFNTGNMGRPGIPAALMVGLKKFTSEAYLGWENAYYMTKLHLLFGDILSCEPNARFSLCEPKLGVRRPEIR